MSVGDQALVPWQTAWHHSTRNRDFSQHVLQLHKIFINTFQSKIYWNILASYHLPQDELQLRKHTHTRLTALCLGLPGGPVPERKNQSGFYWSKRQWMAQWHQLGHMQVCTSHQADNHASTPQLSFLQAGCLPATQPTVSKHWRHKKAISIQISANNLQP